MAGLSRNILDLESEVRILRASRNTVQNCEGTGSSNLVQHRSEEPSDTEEGKDISSAADAFLYSSRDTIAVNENSLNDSNLANESASSLISDTEEYQANNIVPERRERTVLVTNRYEHCPTDSSSLGGGNRSSNETVNTKVTETMLNVAKEAWNAERYALQGEISNLNRALQYNTSNQKFYDTLKSNLEVHRQNFQQEEALSSFTENIKRKLDQACFALELLASNIETLSDAFGSIGTTHSSQAKELYETIEEQKSISTNILRTLSSNIFLTSNENEVESRTQVDSNYTPPQNQNDVVTQKYTESRTRFGTAAHVQLMGSAEPSRDVSPPCIVEDKSESELKFDLVASNRTDEDKLSTEHELPGQAASILSERAEEANVSLANTHVPRAESQLHEPSVDSQLHDTASTDTLGETNPWWLF